MQIHPEGFEWPVDTVIVSYNTLTALQNAVFDLWSCEQVFVVSPKHSAIAMSHDAAILIGVEGIR